MPRAAAQRLRARLEESRCLAQAVDVQQAVDRRRDGAEARAGRREVEEMCRLFFVGGKGPEEVDESTVKDGEDDWGAEFEEGSLVVGISIHIIGVNCYGEVQHPRPQAWLSLDLIEPLSNL